MCNFITDFLKLPAVRCSYCKPVYVTLTIFVAADLVLVNFSEHTLINSNNAVTSYPVTAILESILLFLMLPCVNDFVANGSLKSLQNL